MEEAQFRYKDMTSPIKGNEMHIISFMFKSNQQVMQFHYDLEADARKHFEKTKDWNATDRAIEIVDNYGSRAVIRIDDIAGVFMTDLSKEADAMKKKLVTQKKVEISAHKEAMGAAGNIMSGRPGIVS